MKHIIKLEVVMELSEDAFDEWIEMYDNIDGAIDAAKSMVINANTNEDPDNYFVSGKITLDGVEVLI